MKALAFVLLLAPAAAAAQMHKCVAASGATSYSDQPCAGAKGGAVDIHGSPPLSGQLRAPDEDLRNEDAAFRRRQIERDGEAEKEAKARVAAQRGCTALRNEQARLSAARRVILLDGKGGQTYMDDQERDRRLAELNDKISRCR